MTRSTIRTCAVLWLALVSSLALAGIAWGSDPNHREEATFADLGVVQEFLTFTRGIAVDNSTGPSAGSIYVAVPKASGIEGVVSKITEAGVVTTLIDGSETPQGSFSYIPSTGSGFPLDSVAVDSSSGSNRGRLYVVDAQHGVIDRFGEDGHYQCQITSAGPPSPSECNGPAGSATPGGAKQWGGIEVSKANGHVFALDEASKSIYEFGPSGAFVGQISDPHLTMPSALALDSTGAIYVVESPATGTKGVVKLSAAGTYLSTVPVESPFTLAVDQATDHLYVSDTSVGQIREFDVAGAQLAAFGGSLPLSLAVNEANGRVYVGVFSFLTGGAAVNVFGPAGVNVPTVTAAPAAAVLETTASLSGTVDPDGGEAVGCRFEYGPTTAYGQSAPCVPATPFASSTAVAANLTGLNPSTTYHFRLAAENPPVAPRTKSVPGVSPDQTFVTEGPPTIEAESSANVERYGATLKATIHPHGYDSEFKFQYVDDAHFQAEGFVSTATRSTSLSELGGGVKVRNVSQDVGNLAIGTTYHYRAVATNARGTRTGPGKTFATLPVATIDSQWAYGRFRSVRLEAKANPLGFQSSCRVELVAEAEFSQSGYANALSQPCLQSLGGGSAAVGGRVDVGGLQPSTKYHYRFVVTNQSGSVAGADQTFSTFGFASFSVEILDEEGNPYTQAGGHPYQKIIRYRFSNTVVPNGTTGAGSLTAFVKNLITEQPAGHSGIRDEETPKCPGYLAEAKKCSPESQVGTLTVEYFSGTKISTDTRPMYNVVAPDGVASRYATLDPYSASDTSVRTGSDYGTSSTGGDIGEEAKVVGATLVIWGIPADHVSGATRSAILRNPTSCTGPQTVRVRADTWQEPGTFVTATTQLPAVTGCDKLEFHPSIEWRPTATTADSPTGLHVGIHQEQNASPDELAFADLQDVVINPAKGMIFNPSGANGLVGCSSEQIGIKQETPARCPDAAKIGKVQIDTPLVDHPLRGGIYMATPYDNQFDSLFAIYLVVSDSRSGVVVKLAGNVEADSGDGQLTADFSENPQLPVEDFKLDFFGGPRSVLRTPATCGAFPTGSSLTPWSAPQSGPPLHPTDSYEIAAGANGGPCFASEAEIPEKVDFSAGTLDAKAGSYSPFVIRLHREDGTQQIAKLAVKPPPGLLGKLAGIPRCADAAIEAASRRSGTEERAQPSCSSDSRVGSVVVAAGAGSEPYHAEGSVYVGGPYRGAPLSLAVVVPVIAGPFDLGTVVVRTPLRIDLETGQVDVDSDPLPTILEGVPLNVRTVEVRLDRPGFTVNPTNSDPAEAAGSVTSTAGRTVSFTYPFQLTDCRKLGFKPKVGLRLLGKTHRRAHPALRAVLTMPEGGANISRVAVAMPPSQFLDNSNIREICTRAQFATETCPKGSVYGFAKAWSPLLDQPLAGPVFMRSSTEGLPDLVAELNGEFRLAVAGQIDSRGGGIGADIKGLPDVPVSKFVMTMKGGPRGLLQNSLDVCKHRERGRIRFEAQNGRVATLEPLLKARCPRQGGSRKHRR
jgi:hypothetical protein